MKRNKSRKNNDKGRKLVVLDRINPAKSEAPHLGRVRATFGDKVENLLRLPPAWTPPFFVISGSLSTDWAEKRQTIPQLLERAGIDLRRYLKQIHMRGYDQMIVRSSAVNEKLDDRGRYASRVQEKHATFDKVCTAIEEIYFNYFQQKANGSIGVIIQAYVAPEISGHLSNEVHLTPTRNQWKYEVERPGYSPLQGLNSKFATSPDETSHLIKRPEEQLNQILRRVGHWINIRIPGRNHVEWCFADNTVWLVQIDLEPETSIGADPRKMPPLRRPIKGIPETKRNDYFKVFQPYQIGKATPWSKLQNVNDFAVGDDVARHQLFYATAASVRDALRSKERLTLLRDEIDWRAFGRAVIRTDTVSDKLSRFNLPRTHTVTGDVAVTWLAEQLNQLEKTEVDLNEVCFIMHEFIPARAAAWTYFGPNAEVVEIDALWGLPDGLQFLPHDSFQCDPHSGEVLSEKIRYKPQFLQEQNDGTWRYVTVARQFGRTRSLSAEALEEISTQTVAIAEKLQGPAQIMWFCDISPELGLGNHLPWYRTKEAASRLETKRPPAFKSIEISTPRDLKDVERSNRKNIILCLMPDANLIRDDKFLNTVIDLAKKYNLPIELAGSILGHAYYRLRSEQITVYAAEPYATYYRVRGRKEFHKLVRDQIPKKISRGGEQAIQVRLTQDDSLLALLVKLIEEGLELANAKTENEHTEELADMYEVLRALANRSGTNMPAVEKAANMKREIRGGFDENVFLLETRKAIPRASIERDTSKVVGLYELGVIRLTDAGAIIPLSQVMRPGSTASFIVSLLDSEIEVRARLTSNGIELSLGLRKIAEPGQMTFDF